MYSNLLFVIFFVVLLIKCVSLPNLSISSSTRICNSSIFVLAILFLIFTIVFRRVSNLSLKVMLVNLIQYRGAVGEFNCKKCVCANSSNLFPDKFFQTWQSFQTLPCLLLTNSIFLNLLFFCRTMKNVKVKKIQILLSSAFHSAAVTLLIHHI